ncbi:RES family NAD+ phosphorylase [Segetibacter sp.]|jgi:RES domain-containing protein|uniref:RES family NAD+ phosphorylase n=1 Tax=Segetibacter sp. TaxID=2231182 RepID=UPI00261FDCED|nr:RES family NAD+ phosphorylase [Segetibacter sp.]MCW3081522.1 superfamily protein [Segetibacter sp.]
MIVYRLSKGKYHRDISGKGAEMYGGRWNSKGTALLYTSQSRALAFAEISMHIPLGIVPLDYFLISIQIPDTADILELAEADMPADWRSNPHSDSTQKIGDQFAAELKHLALRVPSAVVPGDWNYLINPSHPMTSEVTIVEVEPFQFDSRFAFRGA